MSEYARSVVLTMLFTFGLPVVVMLLIQVLFPKGKDDG